MKVSELIEALQEVDQDAEIVLSADAEGNHHAPLSGFWVGIYLPECGWRGSVYDEDELKEQVGDGYIDEADLKNCIQAVIFNPA